MNFPSNEVLNNGSTFDNENRGSRTGITQALFKAFWKNRKKAFQRKVINTDYIFKVKNHN
jgi:hypothetical protein